MFPAIPLDTAKAARAVFGQSNFYLAIGDQANRLFEGINLTDLPWQAHTKPSDIARLYLLTIFQFRETLPDHLAADAILERVDWKYALHLPLSSTGMASDLLCNFRRWLLADQTGQQNIHELLLRLPEITEFSGKMGSSIDPMQVINMVCVISRLAFVWDTLNQTLEALAIKRPDWLLAINLPHWYERYSHHQKYLNLNIDTIEMNVLAQSIGADGCYLLEALKKTADLNIMKLKEIQVLREVWREQFVWEDNKTTWREDNCSGCYLASQSFKPGQSAHLNTTEVMMGRNENLDTLD
jgi:hypothetical protein